MSQSSTDPQNDDSQLSFRRILAIGCFICIGLFAAYTYYRAKTLSVEKDSQLAEQTELNTQLLAQMANLESAMADMKTAKVYEQQEQAVSANHALGVLERGEVIRQNITQLGEARTVLATRLNGLLESEEGKRIASSIELIEQAMAALAVTLPPETQAETLSARLSGLMQAPQQAIQQQISGYTPGESLLGALSQIESEIIQSRTLIDRVSSELNVLARSAESLPINTQQSLGDAIGALEEIKEQQRSEIVAKAKEDAKLEAAKLLAAQEAENERLLAAAKAEAAKLAGEKMAEQIVADAKAEKQRQDAALREKEAALAKAKLETEFNRDLPQIRNYLTAFISDGYELRGNNSGKGPVSLSALRGTRMFQPGRPGLESIIYFANNANDRPRGPIERETGGDYGWKIADKDTLNTVQSYLSKYGEIMVEKGMLAP
ncbi:MAG: hypothetical protein IT422_06235 [Pirellulaceae bacterium]|nr:hypothetical protein [Pirellulaceae bacterium]